MSAICAVCSANWAGFDWEQDEPPCYCGHDPRITRATPAPRPDIGGEMGLLAAIQECKRLMERGETDMDLGDIASMAVTVLDIRRLDEVPDGPKQAGGWSK